jgi:DNA-binding PadR family transcriptional regulator
MSLPHGLLGLLTYGESTGYELMKIFEASLNNFWHAQSSQIYRELDRMEEKGLVTSRHVPQEGKPNKRVYAITDSGKDALQEWLLKAWPAHENQHISILMRVFFGGNAPESTLDLLRSHRDHCLEAVEKNSERVREAIDYYAKSVPGGDEKRLYWEMTFDYGIRQAQVVADWAEDCIKKVEEFERTRKEETENAN